MKWKARSNSEAGEVLKLLAKQGEPLLKQLDTGKGFNPLTTDASNDDNATSTDLKGNAESQEKKSDSQSSDNAGNTDGGQPEGDSNGDAEQENCESGAIAS